HSIETTLRIPIPTQPSSELRTIHAVEAPADTRERRLVPEGDAVEVPGERLREVLRRVGLRLHVQVQATLDEVVGRSLRDAVERQIGRAHVCTPVTSTTRIPS